uniref:NACHT LRR and PYD domain-containing protein n=1 Tax=Oncorhynchus mykiss TaxID=8022 RepID=A0A8K9X930_ONCMY
RASLSSLTKLDLSHDDLHDTGVKWLSAGLQNPNCKLEILRLSFCGVTEEDCNYLASALGSNPSHLRDRLCKRGSNDKSWCLTALENISLGMVTLSGLPQQ